VKRRAWMLHAMGLLAPMAPRAAPGADGGAVRRGRALAFPRDHGAHPEARTEWWYITGWLGTEAEPRFGFQLTFFRSRTGLAEGNPSRFAARQLLFAHAAVTDLAARTHRHEGRITRWAGDEAAGAGSAASEDTDVRLGRWTLRREGGHYRASLPAERFTLDLRLQPSQPLLLQGDAGFSRKGPEESQASHYYSEPQLQAGGSLLVGDRRHAAQGRAWLDHEWSEQILHPDAVGWDWLGINLFDGSALTVFRLRRADGSTLWAGGSFRAAGGTVRAFAPEEVRLTPGRTWRSPASAATYPVQWTVETPAGRFDLRALLDAQELDSRGSTGTIYWEGLSELRDAGGRRVGLGYLELTGYAAPLRMA
jgi:predicted secreted hydrolase